METGPLIEALASNASYRYETLAYLDAYDAVLDCDFAFVAYKETQSSGEWRVWIKSAQTPGTALEPATMRNKALEATAQGKTWFQWGYSLDPSPGDPRNIHFRVHVKDGHPSEIEMFVQLRLGDGSADAAQSVKFLWPGA